MVECDSWTDLRLGLRPRDGTEVFLRMGLICPEKNLLPMVEFDGEVTGDNAEAEAEVESEREWSESGDCLVLEIVVVLAEGDRYAVDFMVLSAFSFISS